MSQETRSGRIRIQTDADAGNRATLIFKKEIQFARVLQQECEVFPEVSIPKQFIGRIRNSSLNSQRTGHELSRQSLDHSAKDLHVVSDPDFLSSFFWNEVPYA